MANWDRIAEQSNGMYVASDYQQAAYKLMMEQTVYAGDRSGRIPFELITRHLGSFRDVFEQFGMSITHNPHHGYIVAIPKHAFGARMRLEETRLALLLRRIYDDRVNALEVVEGEAFVTMIDLEQDYRKYFARAMPDRADIRGLIRSLKRNGMAREIDAEDDQPFQIVIRPAITDILGETALLQLAAYGIEKDHDATEADDEAS